MIWPGILLWSLSMLTGPEKFRPGIPGFAEFADADVVFLPTGTDSILTSLTPEEPAAFRALGKYSLQHTEYDI